MPERAVIRSPIAAPGAAIDQVVSGPVGRERVHFEAPAAERLDGEMQTVAVASLSFAIFVSKLRSFNGS
jgi:hypothetical protein